jgi:protein HOOK3
VKDNWVLKFNNLKRLFKLLTQFCEDELGLRHVSTHLEQPDLNAMAKVSSPAETLKFVRIILLAAVQCKKNQV